MKCNTRSWVVLVSVLFFMVCKISGKAHHQITPQHHGPHVLTLEQVATYNLLWYQSGRKKWQEVTLAPSPLVTPSAMQNTTAKPSDIKTPESAAARPVAVLSQGSLPKAFEVPKVSPPVQVVVTASPSGGGNGPGPVPSDAKALESYRKPIVIAIVTGEDS